jgi:hypothetical protein
MLQTFVNTNNLRLHSSMEDIIISLKAAKNKLKQPYSLDKQKSAFDDSLDALRLVLCLYEIKELKQ